MELKRTPAEYVFKDSDATFGEVLDITCAIAGEDIPLTPKEQELLQQYGGEYLQALFSRYSEEILEGSLFGRPIDL